MNKVLMLASENGAFKGAKVGGIADVIRDLPAALHAQQIQADIVMPSYGFLTAQTDAELLAEFTVEFKANIEQITIYKTANPTCPETCVYLIDHSSWHHEPGKVYTDSGDRPFADDANLFALFSVAVAEGLHGGYLPRPDCVHIHDWHSAFFLLCSRYMSRYQALSDIDCVLTIHNLAIQGIRPLQDDESSLAAWFPKFYAELTENALQQIRDPRYQNCINPLRAAINLANRIHVVSPTYAKEILQPSDTEHGYFGGEGLERDLQRREQDTYGIINGCNYPSDLSTSVENFQQFTQLARDTLADWRDKFGEPNNQYSLTDKRLEILQTKQFTPAFLMTSVGRLTDQKVLILRQKTDHYETVLDAVLERLHRFSSAALFIMVGSGDPKLTRLFVDIASRHDNFIFLNGYAESLPDWLYQQGDLFLMPSSFEPCGISQMLAMREGQPCLVHGVGGLRDTVEHKQSGFVFGGSNLDEQARHLLDSLDEALATYKTDLWNDIKACARSRRFSWPKVAKQMQQTLYRFS